MALYSVPGRVWVSYIFDWVIVIVFLAIAGALNFVEPVKRDFSLTDRAISFPYRKDTISIPVLFIIAVAVPIVVIAVVSLLFVRFPINSTDPRSSSSLWRRKLWELHAGWLGLALATTLSLLLTQTMKNMFGKHRPDFLARCNPDVANMGNFTVGGFTSELLEGTSVLVDWQICISKNGSGVGYKEFIDGFRSFPSGHSTIAFAGLAYLSLYLATKLSTTIPGTASAFAGRSNARERAAAPPLYLLVIVLIPIAAAIYIVSTRYTDNKHAGFDILFGSAEGLVCAWFAIRWYHPPISIASGWAWAPRHKGTAFGVGMGVGSYADTSYAQKGRNGDADVEQGLEGRRSEALELRGLQRANTAEGSYSSHQPLHP
ncbi:uncharacterized protein PV09_08531 [Verruconis gallopava]|uniref:Phosphatidic acid phosphatase type 2/haloperoxidase domain-containing protein n=1 Tax=Verruconis gallopava TaxID=253628 RepID=A0A0D2ALB3_9PEZI|nr:uncharacterized protein PV09_08531 [Verruconis gallopava]KIV99863.1 hypothetical protein PV09_08531 [Verruconis gallopava]